MVLCLSEDPDCLNSELGNWQVQLPARGYLWWILWEMLMLMFRIGFRVDLSNMSYLPSVTHYSP